MVLCVDEKTQIQALDRTQPLLPMGLGYVEGVTHDYIRHGTTTQDLEIHLVVDNYCTHKHALDRRSSALR
jgi:putative transposase